MLEDSIFSGKHKFFKENWNIIYGSLKKDEDEGFSKDNNENSSKEEDGSTKLEFWTGLASRKIYKHSKNVKEMKIIINEERIGRNLERRVEEESIFEKIADQFFKEREYMEIFEKDDGRVLEVKYKHLSWRSFFKEITNPTLQIKYRYKDKDSKETYPWNRLTIKSFADLDYGIDLPDKGYNLAGSKYNGEIKKERLNTQLIEIGEIREKGRGKVKIDGNYLKTDDLTTLEMETKEETPIVYQDANGNKYSKGSEGNLFINYLDKDAKTETLYIPSFQEGDYGLWIEKEAPYYLDGDSIINNISGEKAPKNKVLKEEGNEWLKEEERIKEEFLWIYPGEEIIFPEVEEEQGETEQTDEAANTAVGANAQVAATKENSNKNQKDKSEGESSGDSSTSSNQARLYVCDGATLQCNQGDKKSTYKVVDIHNIYIQGNSMATIEDSQPMINIKPFGKCKSMVNPTVSAATAANHGHLKPMPCQPNIPGNWLGGKEDVRIAGIGTVLETSKLNCAYAGVITIVDPGQDLVRE
jgi:hypothetical protein